MNILQSVLSNKAYQRKFQVLRLKEELMRLCDEHVHASVFEEHYLLRERLTETINSSIPDTLTISPRFASEYYSLDQISQQGINLGMTGARISGEGLISTSIATVNAASALNDIVQASLLAQGQPAIIRSDNTNR